MFPADRPTSSKHDNTIELVPFNVEIDDARSGQSTVALLSNQGTPQKPSKGLFRRTSPRTSSASWRTGIKTGILAGGVVLVINIVTLIVVYTRFNVQASAAVVFEGSCTTAKNVTIASHVLINILSTILLAYSNYGMQCMSAPSRSEIDKAHGKRRWLSIGTPNVRNVFFVSRSKMLLWLLLGSSSFPLHLLWNSTVFQTQMSVGYLAVSVTPAFLQGAAWTVTNATSPDATTISITPTLQHLQDMSTTNSSSSSLQYLNDKSCIEAYGSDLQSKYRSVVLVVDAVNVTTSSNNSVLAVFDAASTDDSASGLGYTSPFLWMCDASYDGNSVNNGGAWACPPSLLDDIQKGDPWIPGASPAATTIYGAQNGNPVQYCYAEKLDANRDHHCQVSVVPVFLIVVIICNLIKIVALSLSLRISSKECPLVTTGDAIQSFLEQPDSYTNGRCLVSKYDYDTRSFRRSKEWQPRPEAAVDIWDGGRYRWGKAMRARQWTMYILSVSTAIMLAGAFFGPDGIGSGTTESWSAVLDLGIGTPHPNYILSLTEVDLLTGFLTANSPQIIVSYLYLGLSNMLTTMLAMFEWTSYGQTAKGLRVSSPHKNTAQRSTYFLSLPYRYAIPMTATVALLHYFISEMVFLARIEFYGYDGQIDAQASVTNIFFSPLAMLLAVSLGSAIVLVLIFLGIFRKYPGNVPLAGCCSASIAAACQPSWGKEHFNKGMADKKLMWGVVSYDEGAVGHATFAPADMIQGALNMGEQYR